MKLSAIDPTRRLRLDELDLYDPGFYAEGDPHQVWYQLRSEEPVRWQRSSSLYV
jgi:hypothetical protein